MIAEYLARRDAEIYASELGQLYGPAVHFHVVGMADPVFGDTVWYVLGTGMVDGQMFAQYAQERKQWPEAATVTEKREAAQFAGLTSVEARHGKQRLATTDAPLTES